MRSSFTKAIALVAVVAATTTACGSDSKPEASTATTSDRPTVNAQVASYD